MTLYRDMERTQSAGRTSVPRRVAGAALVASAPVLAMAVATLAVSADQPRPGEAAFENASGAHRTMSRAGFVDDTGPFFEDLGTNGRRCVTCHQPAEAWTITPRAVRQRFDATAGLDPLFRTNDGSNCEGAPVATIDERREAFGLLASRAVIRIGLDVPAGAEFDIVDVDDPYRCGAPFTRVSVYRRPLPTTNLGFLSTVMWDGRKTTPGRAIRDDLMDQAIEATVSHAQGAAPTPAQVRDIVAFELGLFTGQVRDADAGSLGGRGGRGGPRPLSAEPFCLGINDPLGMLPPMPGACAAATTTFDPVVFRLFPDWAAERSEARRAIARGETVFNTRHFVIDDVKGLNGDTLDPVPGPIASGTCTICHDTPNAGNHSVPMPLDIGITHESRRSPDLPLFTLRNRTTGETIRLTDPGRALVTGKWRDAGKFKGPILRALAARPPYFHDGSAARLEDVVEFYDTRFHIGLSALEKADLLAFLRAL